MSSALKDARWQLAEEMATDDGFDWFKLGFAMKSGYLGTAQEKLDSAWGAENVERLAAKFRSGQ